MMTHIDKDSVLINREKAVSILKKYASDQKAFLAVYAHCTAVCCLAEEIALSITENSKLSPDINLVVTGAMLHDIGRFLRPPGHRDSINHGLEGAAILRNEGLFKQAYIAERHIGAGISPEEAAMLGMPAGDYRPVSLEEKIVAHADNLIFNIRRGTIKEVIIRFKREVGSECAENILNLHKELQDSGAFIKLEELNDWNE